MRARVRYRENVLRDNDEGDENRRATSSPQNNWTFKRKEDKSSRVACVIIVVV